MLLPVFDYTQCLMLHISIMNKICILQMSFMVMSLILFLLLYTCITRVRFNQQSESRFMVTLSPSSVYWQRLTFFAPFLSLLPSPVYCVTNILCSLSLSLLFIDWETYILRSLSLSLSCFRFLSSSRARLASSLACFAFSSFSKSSFCNQRLF